MADEVNQLAHDGRETEATTKAANAARTAALGAHAVATSDYKAAKLAADQALYSAAIAAEEACASSVNAVVNVDPNPPEEE